MSESAIIEKVLSSFTLARAFERAKANGGVAGGDGINATTMERFLTAELKSIADQVRSDRYQPGPLRSVSIPKNNGTSRLLRIPCLRDRILQGAVISVIVPLLDPNMHPGSFGYRPRRSVKMALDALKRCQGWVLDADIFSFFDRVKHRPLRKIFWQNMPSKEVRRLVDLWLYSFGRCGLAQGAPISPLLANLALGPLDEAIARHGFLVRYADDFVVVCSGQAEAIRARKTARRVLRQTGLQLHPEKTRIFPPGTTFNFLGSKVNLAGKGVEKHLIY